ncbi:MAG: hypothetical protein JSS40_08050 [Proteobacteria bacterium]|nr:hypothetical protein [Pseudomonadota bacterium]
MNASEIEFIEGRLPVSLQRIPSPEQMEQLIARAKRERNVHMAVTFVGFVAGMKAFFGTVRRIAAACTSARLHQA